MKGNVNGRGRAGAKWSEETREKIAKLWDSKRRERMSKSMTGNVFGKRRIGEEK